MKRITGFFLVATMAALIGCATIHDVETGVAYRHFPSIVYAEYPAAHNDHRLQLWVPEEGDAPFPLFIFVQGGAFAVSGHAETFFNDFALARGYAVASVQHRVLGGLIMTPAGPAIDYTIPPYPAAMFPNQTLDVLAAIRYLRANADKYRLDTTRFAIGGHSAGGYHAKMIAALSNSPTGIALLDPDNISETLGNTAVSGEVMAAVSWNGLSDFILLDSQLHELNIGLDAPFYPQSSPNSPLSRFIGGSLFDPAMESIVYRTNPLNYVHSNMPPVLLISWRDDELVPYLQATIFADRIRQVAGYDRVVLELYDVGGHFPVEQMSNTEHLEKVFTFLDNALNIQR
ncbi:MAG: alpha/beta hydrolase [Spirochaetes bacterium]|nr:alpha/beta hydrolase [Spirochaetota bacterium]